MFPKPVGEARRSAGAAAGPKQEMGDDFGDLYGAVPVLRGA